MSDLDERVLASIRKSTKTEGAMWTSDIAWGVRASTAATRYALIRLEKRGLVRRVVIGRPTSWEAPTSPTPSSDAGGREG